MKLRGRSFVLALLVAAGSVSAETLVCAGLPDTPYGGLTTPAYPVKVCLAWSPPPKQIASAVRTLKQALEPPVYERLVTRFDRYYCNGSYEADPESNARVLDLAAYLTELWRLNSADSPLGTKLTTSALVLPKSEQQAYWRGLALIREAWEKDRRAEMDSLPDCPQLTRWRDERIKFCADPQNATLFPDDVARYCAAPP